MLRTGVVALVVLLTSLFAMMSLALLKPPELLRRTLRHRPLPFRRPEFKFKPDELAKILYSQGAVISEVDALQNAHLASLKQKYGDIKWPIALQCIYAMVFDAVRGTVEIVPLSQLSGVARLRTHIRLLHYPVHPDPSLRGDGKDVAETLFKLEVGAQLNGLQLSRDCGRPVAELVMDPFPFAAPADVIEKLRCTGGCAPDDWLAVESDSFLLAQAIMVRFGMKSVSIHSAMIAETARSMYRNGLAIPSLVANPGAPLESFVFRPTFLSDSFGKAAFSTSAHHSRMQGVSLLLTPHPSYCLFTALQHLSASWLSRLFTAFDALSPPRLLEYAASELGSVDSSLWALRLGNAAMSTEPLLLPLLSQQDRGHHQLRVLLHPGAGARETQGRSHERIQHSRGKGGMEDGLDLHEHPGRRKAGG